MANTRNIPFIHRFAPDPHVEQVCLTLAEDIDSLQEWDCLTSLEPSLEIRQEDLLDLITEGGSLCFLLWSEETVHTAEAAVDAARGMKRGIATREDTRNTLSDCLSRIGRAAAKGAVMVDDRNSSNFLTSIADRISGYLDWFNDDPAVDQLKSPWLEIQLIENAQHLLGAFVSLSRAEDAGRAVTRVHQNLNELSLAGAAVVNVQPVVDSGQCLANVVHVRLFGDHDRIANLQLLACIAQWRANEIPCGELCFRVKQCVSDNHAIRPLSWAMVYQAWSSVWIVVHGKTLADSYEADLPKTISNEIRSLLAQITHASLFQLD